MSMDWLWQIIKQDINDAIQISLDEAEQELLKALSDETTVESTATVLDDDQKLLAPPQAD